MPFPWGWLLRGVERRLGKPLVANRILGWSPRTLLGSGIMEGLVVHDDPEIPRRLLKLLRIYVSYRVSCPFCVDLNAQGHEGDGVSAADVQALAQGSRESWDRFAPAERAALEYADCLTATPVRFPDRVIEGLKEHFTDRAFTVIAATVAQVNFWTRMIQGLGVSEAGFSEHPELLALDTLRTRVP